MVTFGFLERIPHVIAGEVRPGRGDRVAPVFDPATGRQTAEVGLADVAEVDEAVSAAVSPSGAGGRSPSAGGCRCCSRSGRLVAGHEDELAAVITAQHGKTLADAAGRGAPGARVHRVRVRPPRAAQR